MIFYTPNSRSISAIKQSISTKIFIQYKSGVKFYEYGCLPDYFKELQDYSIANNGSGINRKIIKDMKNNKI